MYDIESQTYRRSYTPFVHALLSAIAAPLRHLYDPQSTFDDSMTALTENAKPWVLYLLECANGAYYAGITNNLAGRLAAHARGRGAKYTRANPPVRLVGSRSYPDRAQASKAEWKIKQLPRLAKLAFITALAGNPHGHED